MQAFFSAPVYSHCHSTHVRAARRRRRRSTRAVRPQSAEREREGKRRGIPRNNSIDGDVRENTTAAATSTDAPVKSSRAASEEALSPSLHLRPRLRRLAPEAKRARKEAHAISAAKGKLRALTHRGQGHGRSIAALVVVVVVARRPARSIAAASLDDAKRGKGEGGGRRSERGPPKLCKLPPLWKEEKDAL